MAPGVVPSSLHGGLHHFLTSQHPPLIHSHGWPSCKLQWTLTNIKIWLLIWAEGTSHGKQSWQIKRTQEMHWQEHPHIREETFQPQPGIYCLGSKRRGHATGTGSSSRQILGWVVSFTTSKHFSHSPPFFVSADPFVVSCPAGKTSVFLLEVLLKLLHFKQPVSIFHQVNSDAQKSQSSAPRLHVNSAKLDVKRGQFVLCCLVLSAAHLWLHGLLLFFQHTHSSRASVATAYFHIMPEYTVLLG